MRGEERKYSEGEPQRVDVESSALCTIHEEFIVAGPPEQQGAYLNCPGQLRTELLPM
jgi:hypothetical protein